MGIELSEFMTDLPAEKLAIRGMWPTEVFLNRIMEEAPEDVEFSLDPEENIYTGMVDGVIVTLTPGMVGLHVGVQLAGPSPRIKFSLTRKSSWRVFAMLVNEAANACRKLSELL